VGGGRGGGIVILAWEEFGECVADTLADAVAETAAETVAEATTEWDKGETHRGEGVRANIRGDTVSTGRLVQDIPDIPDDRLPLLKGEREE
jgi:hypothetical protein